MIRGLGAISVINSGFAFVSAGKVVHQVPEISNCPAYPEAYRYSTIVSVHDTMITLHTAVPLNPKPVLAEISYPPNPPKSPTDIRHRHFLCRPPAGTFVAAFGTVDHTGTSLFYVLDSAEPVNVTCPACDIACWIRPQIPPRGPPGTPADIPSTEFLCGCFLGISPVALM